MTSNDSSRSARPAPGEARRARLGRALRDNLLRRKAQERGRATPAGDVPGDASADGGASPAEAAAPALARPVERKRGS